MVGIFVLFKILLYIYIDSNITYPSLGLPLIVFDIGLNKTYLSTPNLFLTS